MKTEQQTYEELCYYTLNHAAPSFLHQHVVDAFAAQTAGPNDRPVRLVFALIGLYLHVEKHYNGRQVQLAHMKLGREKQSWPVIALPEERGALRVKDIMSKDVFALGEDSLVEDVMHMMFSKKIHTIPIVKDKRLVGVIGKHDLITVCF